MQSCLALSLQIQSRLLGSSLYAEAGCLALYSAVHNEVQTEQIARRAIADGKRLLYPRVAGSLLEFAEVQSPADLRVGAFGILEPATAARASHAGIDVLVVPGIAFDQAGHRLGYGRGFYDRVLASCGRHTLCVGLAYDFQVLEKLPVEPHDRALAAVMTETRTLWFQESAHRSRQSAAIRP